MQPGEVGMTEVTTQQLQYCPFRSNVGPRQLQRAVVALDSDEKVLRRRRSLSRMVQVDHCVFSDSVETSLFSTWINVDCRRIS
jgi:hypothetical protein